MDKDHISRDRILNASAQLFHTYGYHATSLNQIIKESEAPRGSIYYFFPNGKEQLAIEVIKQTGERGKKFIEHSLALEEDAALAISKHVGAMSEELREQLQDSTMSTAEICLVSMSSEVWASNDALRQACEEVYTKWQQMYCDKLVQSGHDRETAQRLAITIQAWIEGSYVLSITTKDSSPMNIISEQILKLFQE